MSSRVNLLLLQRRGSMKLNWFAEGEGERGIKGEWQQSNENCDVCTRFSQMYIGDFHSHSDMCGALHRGMHCITIQWCLKIWQSKIVTWFSTNNNDMRSTQNNFFFFSFLVLGYWFSLTQFPSIPPIFLPRLFPVRAFQEKVEVAL